MSHVRIPLDLDDREWFQTLAGRVGLTLATAMTVRLLLIAGAASPMAGTLSDDPSILEAKLQWKGRRMEGINAMLEAGLLEKTDKGYKVGNWETDHWYFKFNHQRAQKAAKARHAKSRALDGASSSA